MFSRLSLQANASEHISPGSPSCFFPSLPSVSPTKSHSLVNGSARLHDHDIAFTAKSVLPWDQLVPIVGLPHDSEPEEWGCFGQRQDVTVFGANCRRLMFGRQMLVYEHQLRNRNKRISIYTDVKEREIYRVQHRNHSTIVDHALCTRNASTVLRCEALSTVTLLNLRSKTQSIYGVDKRNN